MVSEWKTETAESFCTSVRDGTHDSPKPVVSGKPLITSRHIIGGRIDYKNAYFISNEDFIEINRRSKVDKWDVLISMIGTVGEPCLVDHEPDFAIKNIGLFKSKSEEAARFLYYFLKSPDAQSHIKAQSRGTTQAYMPLNALRAFPIRYPSNISAMKAIAHILGTLDDKIELLHQMNETLEAIARALFKSWFVDFDPVRKKAEGLPTGLPPEIDALFPDSFEDSELGEIPNGWSIKDLTDEFIVTMGQSPPGESYNLTGEGMPFYQGRTDFSFRFPQRRMYCTMPKRIAEEGDTLVSVRAPVGDMNIANEKCCIGRGVSAVRHKSNALSFTYYHLASIKCEFTKFEAEGTVFGSINQEDFHKIRSIFPSTNLIALFEDKVKPLDKNINLHSQEIHSLILLRDSLLPRLISGDLEVKDIDKILEPVT